VLCFAVLFKRKNRMNELFQPDPPNPQLADDDEDPVVIVTDIPQLHFTGDREAFVNGDFQEFISLLSDTILWFIQSECMCLQIAPFGRRFK
jgi:hypothetical protein